jgi:hypothetical protein
VTEYSETTIVAANLDGVLLLRRNVDETISAIARNLVAA